MKASNIIEKIASENRPVSETVSSWGLPEQKVFPLDDKDLTARSAEAFETESTKLASLDKLACARRIKEAADGQGLRLRGLAAKLAGAELSPYFTSFMRMRNNASAGQFGEKIAELKDAGLRASVISSVHARQVALDKLAADIEALDVEANMVDMVDHHFPNAAYTVYGPTLYQGQELPEPSVKVASYDIVESDLEDADWSRLDGKIEAGIIEGIKDSDDKLQIFSSLPNPHKEIIVQSIKG